MSKEQQQNGNKFYITKAWTVAFLIVIGGLIAIYVFRIKPKGTTFEEDLRNIGTIMPLFIYVSTVATETGEIIIMLGKAIYEKIQENRHAKIQKAIAQGESNVINALTKLAKASKGGITVEQAIETYEAQNGNTDSGNTSSET